MREDEMFRDDWFPYSSHGHVYGLIPEVWDAGDKLHLVGAKMYTQERGYVGFWPNSTMPRNLIRELLAWYSAKGWLFEKQKRSGDWGDPYQR
jgi:hypothetical protein